MIQWTWQTAQGADWSQNSPDLNLIKRQQDTPVQVRSIMEAAPPDPKDPTDWLPTVWHQDTPMPSMPWWVRAALVTRGVIGICSNVYLHYGNVRLQNSKAADFTHHSITNPQSTKVSWNSSRFSHAHTGHANQPASLLRKQKRRHLLCFHLRPFHLFTDCFPHLNLCHLHLVQGTTW